MRLWTHHGDPEPVDLEALGMVPVTVEATDAELDELRRGLLRCHFDQKEKVHYVGVFDDGGGAAPRMVLTALRLIRAALGEE